MSCLYTCLLVFVKRQIDFKWPDRKVIPLLLVLLGKDVSAMSRRFLTIYKAGDTSCCVTGGLSPLRTHVDTEEKRNRLKIRKNAGLEKKEWGKNGLENTATELEPLNKTVYLNLNSRNQRPRVSIQTTINSFLRLVISLAFGIFINTTQQICNTASEKMSFILIGCFTFLVGISFREEIDTFECPWFAR